MMKHIALILLLLPVGVSAQQFRLLNGPATGTGSDSRSVNFLDVNNDGWEDLFISNGLKGGQPDLFYINDGTGQLQEVTDQEIVLASEPSDGASFADYNNDGYIDGVVVNWYGREDLLYLNDGKGQLRYNTGTGIAPGSFAETAVFGDFDGDGWLDLYITNSGGDLHNFLYRNLQNGKFERITDHLLVQDAKPSRGAVWVDVNNDNIPDLFVANEENAANDLFIGKGKGTFEKMESGSLTAPGKSSMTASWGDIDNDGDLDLFVGNAGYYAAQQNQLFLNEGTTFKEITQGPLVETADCAYGSAFADYDNDGDLDLLVTHGYCREGLPNALYENLGDGKFHEVSELLTANEAVCSYGVAWGDLDNNGFLDLVVANCQNSPNDAQPPNSVLLNTGNANHWLKIRLEGESTNRSAIGARVKIKAIIAGKAVWQLRELGTQSGYAGQNSLVVHFGLGDAVQAGQVVIRWPDGQEQIMENIAADQQLTIRQ